MSLAWAAGMLTLLTVAAEPTAEQLPLLKTFREEFVTLTPGQAPFPQQFSMGTTDGPPNEAPAHTVTLKAPFAIGKYEVPQNLYATVMGDNPSRWKGPRNSVERVSFEQAVTFCKKTTALLQAAKLIDDTQAIRLPTEAEWEYAARAGTTTAYSFGNDPKDLDKYGWHTGNAAGNDPAVGAKEPNPWKLYDMHGYLWEWCADGWHDTYEQAPTDGSAWPGPADDIRHVIRGGSWREPAHRHTSSYRRMARHDYLGDDVGFRCVLETVKAAP